jgi:hypothetical protein
MVAHEASRRQPKSRGYWRINGTRQMVGGKRVIQPVEAKLDEERGAGSALARQQAAAGKAGKAASDKKAYLTFSSGGKFTVSEGESHVNVTIEREGDLEHPLLVKYKTFDGTAKAGLDYKVRRARGEAATAQPQGRDADGTAGRHGVRVRATQPRAPRSPLCARACARTGRGWQRGLREGRALKGAVCADHRRRRDGA